MTEPAAERPAEEAPGRPRRVEAVLAVAGLAFRESARNRVLHALIAAMVLVTCVAHVIAWVSGDDPVRRLKIVADVVLAAIVLLGTLTAIFLGTNLIYQEVERRTIYTVFARPLGRGGFVLGKYLGLVAIVGLAVAAMAAAGLAGCALADPSGTLERLGKLLVAIGLIYVQLAVVVGVALFFSVAAHPIEGAVFAFVVAAAGQMTSSLRALGAQLLREDQPSLVTRAVVQLLEVAYVLLPDMARFDVRAQAVHDLSLDPAGVAWAVAYGAVYAAILLALATAVFRRRVL